MPPTETPVSAESAQKHRSGDYGSAGWKDFVETGDNYDHRRFQSSPKARKRHERDRRLLQSFLQCLPAGQRVLDAPSGTGRFTELISQCGHKVVAMELNFGRVLDTHRRDPERMPAAQADVFHLPCMDEAFDAVVCFRLLHHLEPELVQRVLNELRRVARRAFVTYYDKHTWSYYRHKLEGRTPRRKYYSRKKTEQWCREAGWKVEKVCPAFGLIEPLHAVWLA